MSSFSFFTWVVKFFNKSQFDGVPQLPPPPEFPDQALLPRDNPLDEFPPELHPFDAALVPLPPRPGGGFRPLLPPQSSEAAPAPPDGGVGLFSLFG